MDRLSHPKIRHLPPCRRRSALAVAAPLATIAVFAAFLAVATMLFTRLAFLTPAFLAAAFLAAAFLAAATLLFTRLALFASAFLTTGPMLSGANLGVCCPSSERCRRRRQVDR